MRMLNAALVAAVLAVMAFSWSSLSAITVTISSPHFGASIGWFVGSVAVAYVMYHMCMHAFYGMSVAQHKALPQTWEWQLDPYMMHEKKIYHHKEREASCGVLPMIFAALSTVGYAYEVTTFMNLALGVFALVLVLTCGRQLNQPAEATT